jgi:hypothetical protein
LKIARLTTSCGLIFGLACTAAWLHPRAAQTPLKTAARTPVVVELFTSEGCSSCPPADALLAKLDTQQPVPGVQIIALEEHVDYWDQLGWRDPFSSAEWTDRQRSYAQVLRSGSVYTPQMIVNGSTEFVGSRARQGSQAIEEAARQRTTLLDISATAVPNKRVAEITVKVLQLEGAKPDDQPEVWLAVTETGLHSEVAGGENAGEDLHHAAVVRKLQRLGSAATKPKAAPASATMPVFAGVKVSLDSGWKRENLRVVAFVQERRSLRILGAVQAPIPE